MKCQKFNASKTAHKPRSRCEQGVDMSVTEMGHNCPCNCHCEEWRALPGGHEEHRDCGECFAALLEEEWKFNQMECDDGVRCIFR